MAKYTSSFTGALIDAGIKGNPFNFVYNKVYAVPADTFIHFCPADVDPSTGADIPGVISSYIRYHSSNLELRIASYTGNIGYNKPIRFMCNKTINEGTYETESDIRKKDVLKETNIPIKNIAEAPIFTYRRKDDNNKGKIYVGTSALYWKEILPEAVGESDDEMKTLSLQYDVTALASVVSLSKKVLELEETIKLLKESIETLKNEVNEIKK